MTEQNRRTWKLCIQSKSMAQSCTKSYVRTLYLTCWSSCQGTNYNHRPEPLPFFDKHALVTNYKIYSIVLYLFSQSPFPCLGKVVQVIRSVVCFLHHSHSSTGEGDSVSVHNWATRKRKWRRWHGLLLVSCLVWCYIVHWEARKCLAHLCMRLISPG